MQASKLHLQRQMTGGNKGLNTWRTGRQHKPYPPPLSASYPLPVTHLTTTNRCLSLSSCPPFTSLHLLGTAASLSLAVCKCLSPAGVLNVKEQGEGQVGAASLSAPWREKPSQVATHKWPRQMLFYLGEILENFSSVFLGGKRFEIY